MRIGKRGHIKGDKLIKYVKTNYIYEIFLKKLKAKLKYKYENTIAQKIFKYILKIIINKNKKINSLIKE